MTLKTKDDDNKTFTLALKNDGSSTLETKSSEEVWSKLTLANSVNGTATLQGKGVHLLQARSP